MLNRENLEILPLKSVTRQRHPLSPLLFKVWSLNKSNKAREGRGKQIGNEEIQVYNLQIIWFYTWERP